MSHGGHYREAHPLVFVMTHWINLVCMVMLAFSGFYIHFPFFPGFMGVARGMHFVAMYVVLINITARIVLAFFVKDAYLMGVRGPLAPDIKNWLPQPENRHQLWPTIKYYLFLKKESVISAKLGAPQKISYLFITFFTFVMAYTGFALYAPVQQLAFFKAGADAVGGYMNMRILHYWGMWVIILFTMVHAYLANVYNFAPSRLIFLWKETPAHGEATASAHKKAVS
jgi:Ni/Fe-hydrogenase 1 B-type cytochrome subunit